MASMDSTHALSADDHDDTVHHEESDVNVRAIFIGAVALLVMAVFCYAAVYLTISVLSDQADAASAVPVYPLAAGQEQRLPPEPRLQTNPEQDLRDLRAEERAALNGYHWVDRNAGVVRIPIDEAKRLVLERGLPARTAAAAQAATSQEPAQAPAQEPGR
jgi:hypothetical protein